jgi:hypothetical protein
LKKNQITYHTISSISILLMGHAASVRDNPVVCFSPFSPLQVLLALYTVDGVGQSLQPLQ